MSGQRVLGSNAPPFLGEVGLLEKRLECGIEVDRHEILKVLRVGSGKRVKRMIGGRKSVHKV